MRSAMSQLNLSARAYHRTRSVKLARTIADLAGSEEIGSVHLAEALHASRPAEDDDGLKETTIWGYEFVRRAMKSGPWRDCKRINI